MEIKDCHFLFLIKALAFFYVSAKLEKSGGLKCLNLLFNVVKFACALLETCVPCAKLRPKLYNDLWATSTVTMYFVYYLYINARYLINLIVYFILALDLHTY